jgi:polar amino acid transport system permease protein
LDQILHYYFNLPVIVRYLPDLLAGLWLTVQMAVAIIAIGVSAGMLLALLRAVRILPINLLLVALVDIVRSIPDIVIIVFVFFALPYGGIRIEPFEAAVISLSIVLAAFSEETFWAGITSVDRGQWLAGRSTGLSFGQTMWLVVLPQAIRLAIPPLTNQVIAITKATSLASVVAVPEILNRASSAQSEAANPSPLLLAAVLLLCVFFPLVRLTRYLERRAGKWRH